MEGIVDYVARDLATPAGGMRSAEDADSEGVEGASTSGPPTEIAAAVDAGCRPPGRLRPPPR